MEGSRFKHFQIDRLLGRGGMGEVYLAIDTTLERRVALKFLPRSLMGDSAAQGRLLDEARSCSRVQHPNIATIHSIEEDGGVYAMVMEYVEGRTLRDVISRQQLSLARVVRIGRAIAAGLIVAHQENVIHRDLKPANVMLTNRGELKIMDFGLALRPKRTVETVGNKAYGTVNYMSPEQARGEKPTASSDIFSYGTLLYELLTREAPFQGENDLSVLQAIVNNEPKPLRNLRRDTPPALEAIIRRCMEKNPDYRYSSMHEVAAELQYVEPDVENGPKDLLHSLATELHDPTASGSGPNQTSRPRRRESLDPPTDGLPRMAPELNVPISDILEALDRHTTEMPSRKDNPELKGFVFAQDLSERDVGPDYARGLVIDSSSRRFDPATSRRVLETAREMPGASRTTASHTMAKKSGAASRRPSTPVRRKTSTKVDPFVGYDEAPRVKTGAAATLGRPAQPKIWKNLIGLLIALIIAAAGFFGLLRSGHRTADSGDAPSEKQPARMQGSLSVVPPTRAVSAEPDSNAAENPQGQGELSAEQDRP